MTRGPKALLQTAPNRRDLRTPDNTAALGDVTTVQTHFNLNLYVSILSASLLDLQQSLAIPGAVSLPAVSVSRRPRRHRHRLLYNSQGGCIPFLERLGNLLVLGSPNLSPAGTQKSAAKTSRTYSALQAAWYGSRACSHFSKFIQRPVTPP